ncbi:hypothetical protein LWM68_02560 [Niabella sp. W65]|nr:hypothetical protein [Niabella sp. W65]MCH7361759.1 hypothetical protein [Niabella sp. W65]ULT46300.1 hypothetical protein KRR40_21090 [Niabella sp. I65]
MHKVGQVRRAKLFYQREKR